MSGRKCKNCGSSDIEVDPARGDAVCTNCGSVLEDNIIVAEVQFEENANGSSSAIGQFVSADSKGGVTKFGTAFHVGLGAESREITLRKARSGITNLANQLRLNQHCVDTACNFFKMALSRNLTRGRRNTHVYAACVYLTCRTEGTAHMLIDISDVLQICCYELGRTYLRLSQSLCINIPSVDPCLYILRFASKLGLGAKTQEVTNTALRLVKRMKRDSLHSGRRPSGLCGAALLMASRLHEFNRTTFDIIKIVKVHESTLRKRLIEFGDTPSSALTLEEFMTVDLEEEQDPPSFKAARKKDKERLQKLMDEEAESITDLQQEIEKELITNRQSGKRSRYDEPKAQEQNDENRFIAESTQSVIKQILSNEEDIDDPSAREDVQLGPNIASMGLVSSLEEVVTDNVNPDDEINLTFDDIDDAELDSYIMNEDEFENKNGLWHQLNKDYLEEQKKREERLAKEKEEGRPEKKKRKVTRRKQLNVPASSAGEAIEKMLQEKKISSKINYEVLKSLSTVATSSDVKFDQSPPLSPVGFLSSRRRSRSISSQSDIISMPPSPRSTVSNSRTPINVNLISSRRRSKDSRDNKANIMTEIKAAPVDEKPELVYESESNVAVNEDDDLDYPDDDEEQQEMGVTELLKKHRQDHDSDYGAGYDYDIY